LSFATIALCVASQVFIAVVYFVMDSVWKLLDTPSYSLKISSKLQVMWKCRSTKESQEVKTFLLYLKSGIDSPEKTWWL